MPRIIHFEIPADDPERAAQFYQKAFDWKIQKWAGPVEYWNITTGEEGQMGINGAIKRREDEPGVVNWVGVDDINAYMARVQELGGKLRTERMVVPGIGYVCYCADTEGNFFGIIQPDMEAK